MARTENLGVRVPADLKAALSARAAADDRSLASLVERLLREGLARDATEQVAASAEPKRVTQRAAAKKKEGA